MNGILEKIVRHKKLEVEQLKAVVPINSLMADRRLKHDTISFKSAILQGSGVIAEFKRASPSRVMINKAAHVKEISKGYELAGASAVSILTDTRFFGALSEDLPSARKNLKIPVLRKDFTIDEYQIYQARTMGADCVLLIAAILSAREIKHFIQLANELAMDSIVELHQPSELDKLSGDEKIIGVNNRNLDTFEVDIQQSVKLADQLGEVLKITESGLSTDANLKLLIDAGYRGFLVGESFMKHDDPGAECKKFVDHINLLKR